MDVMTGSLSAIFVTAIIIVQLKVFIDLRSDV